MATICQWSEDKSYGTVSYRIEKIEIGGSEAIVVQQSGADGWFTLEKWSKGRLMFSVLERLGSLIPEEANEQS